MTPPAVSPSPRLSAADPAGAKAPAPKLRARPPLSRPRPARPPLLTRRTLAASLALHALFVLGVLLAPWPQVTAPASPDDAGRVPGETVEYLDVDAWGSLATSGEALQREVAEQLLAEELGVTAAAVDSILARAPTDVAFPDRVPATIPAAPGLRGAPAGPGAPGGAVPGAGAGLPRTGPGGLGPEYGDRRLVVPAQEVAARELTPLERYQRHFEQRIQALNDSLSGEAERRRRANDWTFTDAEGRRWGLDENGLVVAGQSLKGLPVPNPIPRSARDREDEARRERDQRAEIDRQADQTERDRYLRERGRAMREREDQRREQESADAEEATGEP